MQGRIVLSSAFSTLPRPVRFSFFLLFSFSSSSNSLPLFVALLIAAPSVPAVTPVGASAYFIFTSVAASLNFLLLRSVS